MRAIVFDKTKVHTIADVSKLTNCHQQTLRNWENLNLVSPERITGNQRIYKEKDLKTIEDIIKLRLAGLNIEKIKAVLMSKYQFVDGTDSKVFKN